MLHTQAVRPGTLDLLKAIMLRKEFNQFVLVGGTALALHYGHRNSIDLDLFTNENINEAELADSIKKIGKPYQIASVNPIGIFTFINGVKTDFVHYPYRAIRPLKIPDNIRLLSTEDIAAMKVHAIGVRGAKKDFFDLDELLKQYHVRQVLDFFLEKYQAYDIGHYVKSLTYFDDAETSPMPIMLNGRTWEQAKKHITETVTDFLNDEISEKRD